MTAAAAARPHIILDVHGVILGLDVEAEACARETIGYLRAAGFPLRFLTNSSSVSRSKLVRDLASAGIVADEAEVFTSATTVATFLRSKARSLGLYVVGSPSLREEIQRVCGELIDWSSPEDADVIVVSRAPWLDEHLLKRLAANEHAIILATCRDGYFADGSGTHVGPGRTVTLVERAAERTAVVVGKPNPYVLTDVMNLNEQEIRRCLVVGDSIAQDVMLARNAQARSVFLSPSSDAPADASDAQPDFTIRRLNELLTVIKEYL